MILFSAFSLSKSVSQLFAVYHSVDRFVSKRSSSSLNLDSAWLDDVRAERVAIALSVGLIWPPRQVHEDVWSAQVAAALGTSPAGAHPQPPRASTPEVSHIKTLRAAPAAPAAALVEDEPSGSGSKRRKVHVDPSL